ncbi:MAG: heavy-metal-associated domain-containing protein [Phototrophicaceae bacterium]
MPQKTFVVPNIGCNGCVTSIVNELNELAGVSSVRGDVATKQVSVEWDAPTEWADIQTALVAIEYPPLEAV